MLEKKTSMEVPCPWTRVPLLYEGGGGTRVKPFGNFLRVVKQKIVSECSSVGESHGLICLFILF